RGTRFNTPRLEEVELANAAGLTQ
ncbi:MAG: hypothetical protein K0R08_2262, partial [Solimicrobium sp.]|nr:hypothetical protein [Solimicrobium sp.]